MWNHEFHIQIQTPFRLRDLQALDLAPLGHASSSSPLGDFEVKTKESKSLAFLLIHLGEGTLHVQQSWCVEWSCSWDVLWGAKRGRWCFPLSQVEWWLWSCCNWSHFYSSPQCVLKDIFVIKPLCSPNLYCWKYKVDNIHLPFQPFSAVKGFNLRAYL